MTSDFLQVCLLICRLQMAADKCDIYDNQSLSCLYSIMADQCHPDHFETLAPAVAIQLGQKKEHFIESLKDKRRQPVQILQQGLEEITAWQGKFLFSPF